MSERHLTGLAQLRSLLAAEGPAAPDDADRAAAGELPEDPGEGCVEWAGDGHEEEGDPDALGPEPPGWPAPLGEAAMHGPAGEFVRIVAPHTEADPAALLIQFLAAAGCALGRNCYFEVEADRHYPNLFAVVVGTSGKGRKGTSWGHVRRVIVSAAPELAGRVVEGLSSGEGLIHQVRDAEEREEAVRESGRVVDYQSVRIDAGATDKRLLVCESELARTLKVATREGNTLTALLRTLWDRGEAATLTRTPLRATGAHIGVVAHSTVPDVKCNLTETDAANGFGNRFLWLCARRSKLLPEGGLLSEGDRADLARLSEDLADAINRAREPRRLERTEEARKLWRAVYPRLSAGRPGLLGAITGRAEAQVTRLALVYALLDGSQLVTRLHLKAALEVWRYCFDSARYVFGESLGDGLSDKLWTALRQAGGAGLTRSDLRGVVGKHVRGADLTRALQGLGAAGLATVEREQTSGRPAERWRALEES